MTGIMQVILGGSSTSGPVFPAIGAPYGGGFVGGKISTAASGVADYYLIVAPKASGEAVNVSWGPGGVTTGITSVIAGPTNSASLAALGTSYAAATFCEGLTIGGYSDWYLPAKNELEVLYYFLKPTTDANNTSSGSNANAVSPEPINTNYTSSAPAQTSATGVDGFRTGETNAFVTGDYYFSSTESNAFSAWRQFFGSGLVDASSKEVPYRVRAVRRVPV